MRYLKTNITSTLLVALVFLVASCDSITGDPELPIPLDETLGNTGAFLRIASVQSAAFDLALPPDQAAYEITVEYFDGEGATLLEDVEFYASYESFALDPNNRTELPETTDPILTIPASAFSVNEDSGLPTATITITLQDVVDGFASLNAGDVEVEDQFRLRWDVNLTDGRTFSAEDASPALGGGFYNSPYAASVFVVQAIPEDEFVGTYQFTSQGTGVFGWETFSSTFTADLSVDPDNQLNGRVFTTEPYADDWGGLTPVTVPIALAQTATATADVGTGLGCTLELVVGPITNLENNGVLINLADDSQFTLVVGDNVLGACDAAPVDVAFDVVKQ